ncbi:hypothetical protein NL108_007304 [Boleophthalmus pectinirostris]|nr:hypothetical protein NL108_007304 [Boleophthalmus pectinirostris]
MQRRFTSKERHFSDFLGGGPSPACFYGDVTALPGMFHSMTLNRSTLLLFNYRWFYNSKIPRKTDILTELDCLSTDLTCNLVWFGLHENRKVTQCTFKPSFNKQCCSLSLRSLIITIVQFSQVLALVITRTKTFKPSKVDKTMQKSSI